MYDRKCLANLVSINAHFIAFPLHHSLLKNAPICKRFGTYVKRWQVIHQKKANYVRPRSRRQCAPDCPWSTCISGTATDHGSHSGAPTMLVRWITPLGHHLAVPDDYIPLMMASNHCRLRQRTCQIRKMCLRRIFIIRCALLFVHFKVSMCYCGTILSVSTIGSPTSLLPSPIQRGGMEGVSFGRCAILIGPQTHSFQHFRAPAKGLGGFGSKDPDFQPFPFLKSKDQGFYNLAAHAP